MKHTPTPYKIALTPTGKPKIVDSNGFSITNLTSNVASENEANAAFIVQSCNAHTDLVSLANEISPILDKVIEQTPTGKVRNYYCDLNIKLKQLLLALK